MYFFQPCLPWSLTYTTRIVRNLTIFRFYQLINFLPYITTAKLELTHKHESHLIIILVQSKYYPCTITRSVGTTHKHYSSLIPSPTNITSTLHQKTELFDGASIIIAPICSFWPNLQRVVCFLSRCVCWYSHCHRNCCKFQNYSPIASLHRIECTQFLYSGIRFKDKISVNNDSRVIEWLRWDGLRMKIIHISNIFFWYCGEGLISLKMSKKCIINDITVYSDYIFLSSEWQFQLDGNLFRTTSK